MEISTGTSRHFYELATLLEAGRVELSSDQSFKAKKLEDAVYTFIRQNRSVPKNKMPAFKIHLSDQLDFLSNFEPQVLDAVFCFGMDSLATSGKRFQQLQRLVHSRLKKGGIVVVWMSDLIRKGQPGYKWITGKDPTVGAGIFQKI